MFCYPQYKLNIKIIRINKMNPSRIRPSVIPLKSPSPDFLNSNFIGPTKSPSKAQIIRQNTPIVNLFQSENFQSRYHSKSSYERKGINTTHQTGNYTSLPHNYDQSNFSKGQMIRQLKRILLMINQNEKVSQFRQNDSEILGMSVLRDENERLKIQNSALLEIINQDKNKNEQKQQNIRFKQKLFEIQLQHKKQKESIQSSLKSLTIQAKSAQQANIVLERQNSRLLKLLKQKDDSQRKIYQDMIQSKSKIQTQDLLKKSFNRSQNDRISVVKEYYKNNINNTKEILQSQLMTMEHQISKNYQILSKKVQLSQNRIETLHKFLIATLNIKNKSSKQNKYIQSSSLTSENEFRLNSLVNSLNQKNSQYEKIIFQLEADLLNQQSTNTKNIQTINQKILQIDKMQRDHKYTLIKKDDQIEQLKQINNNLKKQIDKQSKLKPQQIQRLINQKEKQLYEFQTSTQKKVRQLMDTYQRQLEIKNNQIVSKNIELKEKDAFKVTRQNQFQNQIRKLIYKVEDLNDQIKSIEEKLKSKDLEVQKLNYTLQQKIQSQQTMCRQIDQQVLTLKDQINQNRSKNQELNNLLKQKERQCNELIEMMVTFKGRNIAHELKEIKEMLNLEGVIRMQEQLIKVNQSYDRLAMQLQQKMMTIQRLTRQMFLLRQKMVQTERQKALLIQKVGYMQKNIEIYESQLRQRKQFCEDLIQHKSLLQKELVILKKSSASQYLSTPTIKNIILVAQKIDNLIQLQSQRSV